LLQDDCEQLNIYNPQTRMSGDLFGTHGVKLISAVTGNELDIDSGLIIAKDHVHISIETAQKYGIKNNSNVLVGLTCAEDVKLYDNVCAKVSEFFLDEVHIDQQRAPKSLFTRDQHLTGLEATIFKNISGF
jgi:putative phosphotransacetylase